MSDADQSKLNRENRAAAWPLVISLNMSIIPMKILITSIIIGAKITNINSAMSHNGKPTDDMTLEERVQNALDTDKEIEIDDSIRDKVAQVMTIVESMDGRVAYSEVHEALCWKSDVVEADEEGGFVLTIGDSDAVEVDSDGYVSLPDGWE